jgi:TonB family protein
MTTRRYLFLALAIAIFLGNSSLSFASATSLGYLGKEVRTTLQPREMQLWHSPWQNQLQFASVTHTSSRPRCEADRPPEALATPDPLMDAADGSLRITVSFIVGTDGRVHSPFILESAGANEDQTVLHTVQRWRYRPALCNGVPTEVEAKIEFSSR